MKNCYTFAVTIMLGIVALSSRTYAQGVDDPVIISQRVFILQNYVDNFNFGSNAGGELNGFGNVIEALTLEDGEGNGLETHPSTGVDTAARLATQDTGFGTGEGEDFILLQKTFATSTDPDSGETSNTIDASAFNAISYFVKNDSDNGSSSATVAIEILVSDDTGTSTWTQTVPKAISSIATGSNNDFERIVVALEGTVDGVANGFERTDGAHTELTSTLLQNITAVNVLMKSEGESGTPRSIFVDDINFFNNFNLLVEQEKVFNIADGSTVIQVTATLTDANGGVEDQDICFTVTNKDENSQTCLMTDVDGKAAFNYTVTDSTDIVTIDVEPME